MRIINVNNPRGLGTEIDLYCPSPDYIGEEVGGDIEELEITKIQELEECSQSLTGLLEFPFLLMGTDTNPDNAHGKGDLFENSGGGVQSPLWRLDISEIGRGGIPPIEPFGESPMLEGGILLSSNAQHPSNISHAKKGVEVTNSPHKPGGPYSVASSINSRNSQTDLNKFLPPSESSSPNASLSIIAHLEDLPNISAWKNNFRVEKGEMVELFPRLMLPVLTKCKISPPVFLITVAARPSNDFVRVVSVMNGIRL